MADFQRLEEAKSSLQSAQEDITAALKSAKQRLKRLWETLARAKHEEEASRKRYAKLKVLTLSLCDGCWEIFPALEESKFRFYDVNTCVNCGLCLSKSPEGLGLPPASHALDHSQIACEAAEAAIKGQKLPFEGVNDMVTPSWEISGSCDSYNYSNQLPSHNSAMGKSKSDVLYLAEQQKTKAEKKIKDVNNCIENWIKYYNQHKEESKKIKKKLEDVEVSKLSKLSGVKRDRDSLSECIICMEQTNDIVFQCGHQSCFECAWKIKNCHTCRAYISQRITV